MRRLARVVVTLVGVSLVAASCSSDGDGTAPAADASGSELRRVEEVARQALDNFDGVFIDTALAMLAAADRGYAPVQIVEAIEADSLDGAGGIVVDGEVVEPTREPEGFIRDKPEMEGEVVGRGSSLRGLELRLVAARGIDDTDRGQVTFDEMQATFESDVLAAMDEAVPADPETTTSTDAAADQISRTTESLQAVGFIAELLAEGYSVEQVILGFVGGLVRVQPHRVIIQGEDPEHGKSAIFEERSGRGDGVDDESGGEAGGASVEVYDGTYRGDTFEPPDGPLTGPVIEVLDTEVEVTVEEGRVEGRITKISIVQSESSGRTKTEEVTQTVTFTGTVDPAGDLRGSGTTDTEYVLLSCEPEEQCFGARATPSVEGGVEVSLTGSIDDGVFEARTVNSVSGTEDLIEATRV